MNSRRIQARTSISAWLWALVLLPTLPLMGFFAYSVHQYTDERQRSMEARLVDQTNDLANTAQSRLEQSLGALTAMSLSNAAQEDNIPRLYVAAQRLQEASPAMAAISLVNRDEKLVFLSLSPLGTTLPAAQLDSVRETFSTGKPSLSKPFQSPVSSRQIVALNVPVIRDGQVVYVLRGILRVETLSDLINPQSLPPGWIAGIFDRDGVTVARNLSPEVYVGKVAGPQLLNSIRTNDLSVKRGITREGIDTLTVM
ncbi:cache domain-containing protein, partial [Nostoc sp. NIES-2111]